MQDLQKTGGEQLLLTRTTGWGLRAQCGSRTPTNVSFLHGSRNRGNGSRILSRNQQVLCERPLLVDPLPVAAESRARRHLRNLFSVVFMRALCPNRFVS